MDFKLTYRLDSSPVLVSASGELQNCLGFKAEQFLSAQTTIHSIVHADDTDIIDFLFSANDITAGTCTIRLRQANKLVRIFRLNYKKESFDASHRLHLQFYDAKSLYKPTFDLTSNFRAMLENTDDYIFFKDSNHVFTGASQTLVALCSPAEHWSDLLGCTDYDLFPEEFADIYYALEKRVFASGDIAQDVQKYLAKDGTKGWVDNHKYPIKNDAGKITGLFGVARDITHLKKTERALKSREFSLDRTQEAVYWLNDKGRIIDVNEMACKITGYKREEILTLTVFDIDPSFQPEQWPEHWQALKKAGSMTFESETKKSDGTFTAVEVIANFYEYEGEEYDCAYVRDISVRHQELADIQKREARLSQLLNGLTTAVIVHDPDTKIVFSNPRATEILGLSYEQLRGKAVIDPVWRFLDENSQPLAFEQFPVNRIIATKQPIEDLILGIEVPERGNITWALVGGFPEFNQNGELQQVVINFYDITIRQEQGLALSKANEQLAASVQTMHHNQVMMERTEKYAKMASFEWDVKADSVTWSPEMYHIFGRDPSLGAPNLEGQAQLYTPESSQKLYAAIERALLDGKPYRFELIALKSNGEPCPIYVMGFPEMDAQGRVIHLTGLVQDITEHKKAERELRIAAIAFDSQEGMTVTDAEGNILKVNNAFTRITGYSSEEAIGQNPRLLKSGKHELQFYKEMWRQIIENDVWEGEIWNRRKNGEIYPEYLSITSVKDSVGEVTNYVATFNDITLSKATAVEIENLAFYDPLTKLPNRRLLMDRLNKRLENMPRSEHNMALLFLDLDNFKNLNDTLGHDIGDLLLQQAAKRLTDCVREGDTVARLGGDEFVVMLEKLSNVEVEAATQADIIAQKILADLNRPYALGAHVCSNTPSIGITLITKRDKQVDELFKQADIAMYQSKKAGRNTISFFDQEMQEAFKARYELESDLRQALDRNEFELFLQIQVDSNYKVLGAEALIRWRNPKRGLVPPLEFIPYAEESGQILDIGKWVIESALKILATWQTNDVTRGLVLSINVSARQFHQPSFVAEVEQQLSRYGVDPALLKIELTESLLLNDLEETVAKMIDLKRLGIQFSLDDFGTGYSSLQYLKKLPLQQIKIDKTFVRDVEFDSDDRAIVSTIIAMSDTLGIEVIAEGVETEAQKLFLTEKGCHRFQGYLFGKPMPLDEFSTTLEQYLAISQKVT